MIEVIKEFLFYVTLGTGTTMIICLFIAGTISCFCIMLDHLKIANVTRKGLQLYIKAKRPDLKIKTDDIDLSKAGFKVESEDKQC